MCKIKIKYFNQVIKNEVFHDQVLTAALTDRLTHKSHVINMNGPSFRIHETEE